MSKNDGGSAMTIDLESLRLVIAVLDYEARTIPADSRDYGPQREQDVEQDIAGARHIVELALAELTARRARDAEVEALVKAAKDAARDIHLVLSIDGQELELGSLRKLSSAERNLRTTLSAFTGDKT